MHASESVFRSLARTTLGVAAALAVTSSVALAGPSVVGDDGSDTKLLTLYAGQSIEAGVVSLSVDEGDLVVRYLTLNGWELTEAHLWVGLALADMPTTRQGNPIPGQFPHTSGDITGRTDWTFRIPLASLGFSCPGPDLTYYLAAHAALRKLGEDGSVRTETGWTEGSRITAKGNWATYSSFTVTCGPPDDTVTYRTETAWGWHEELSTPFTELEGNLNNWGWTNGPLGEGTHRLELWAAAGRNDREVGQHVGWVTVVYANGTATVTFETFHDDAGIALHEAHLHVGAEALPRRQGDFTSAPGRFGSVAEVPDTAGSHTFVVTGLSGEIYVAAHAVVAIPE